jgi:hypothetical protein
LVVRIGNVLLLSRLEPNLVKARPLERGDALEIMVWVRRLEIVGGANISKMLGRVLVRTAFEVVKLLCGGVEVAGVSAWLAAAERRPDSFGNRPRVITTSKQDDEEADSSSVSPVDGNRLF